MKYIDAVKKIKQGKKRNFTQSIDLLISLKDLNLNSGQKIEEFVTLPVKTTENKICAFVGTELKSQAEKVCDKTIEEKKFPRWTSKKDCKKLAKEYDFFIAQANIMPDIAKTFGKYLGVRGKMPNPKAGQIVPPNAKLNAIVPKIRNMTKLKAAKNPTINCKIGDEKTKDEDLVKNAKFIVEHIIHKLPEGKGNIKKVKIKTTMGKPEDIKI